LWGGDTLSLQLYNALAEATLAPSTHLFIMRLE